MTTNKVDYQRPEIDKYSPDWAKVNDVVAGERAVKAAREVYLPKPNPTDERPENTKRFDQYVDRAVFFNATGRTLDGLVGIAFKRGPETKVPASMDYIDDDIDGAGGGVENQSHRVLEAILKTGRHGLLTDHPAATGSTSKAQQVAGNIHATIATYDAKNIINWRLDKNQNLTLVVLSEVVEEEDGFGIKAVDQWRELAIGRLSDDTESATEYYVQRLWRKSESNSNEAFFIHDEFVPLDASGQPWSIIPFTFVGAVDNNSEVDKAPLLDLACLNIAHYRNSADFEESAYFVGQPTFAFAGLDEQWVKDTWGDGVYVGSRSALPLPVGGSATILEASPNTLASAAMDKKESQMVALGARLLTHGEAIKTAEQSRSETAAAHSVLSLASTNMALAYTQALEWAALFTSGATGEISYTMPTDYTGLNADPILISAIVAAWQSGAIPTADKNTGFRQLGVIDPTKSDEEIDDEIDAAGGGLELGE